MLTENTSLNNVTPFVDSTPDAMVIGKSNTYQPPLLIISGSLLVLLVWIAPTGKSGGSFFKSSAHEITEGASVLADYQVDSANLALIKDNFGLSAVSENDEGKI